MFRRPAGSITGTSCIFFVQVVFVGIGSKLTRPSLCQLGRSDSRAAAPRHRPVCVCRRAALPLFLEGIMTLPASALPVELPPAFLGVLCSATGKLWRDRLDARGAVRALAGKGATLLVTVDCGTTSLEPLAEARRLGMSVVVIDHHQTGDELPEVDALVNPNRPDDLSGLGHLAAVGLVLITLVAVNRELRGRGFWNAERPEPDLLGMLHHVALGTVADVAPLTGLNRAFVAKGLIAMRRRDHVGHTALMDVARLNGPPEAWHLGFMLGPRINAGGRIGRADLGVRLLLEGDVSEAARIAAELDRLNTERRAIEQMAEAQAEAEALASLGFEDKGSVIVTASEGWHPGVVGLVASRLREKFSRPAFAIALEPGGLGTGSGRSIC